MALNISLCLLFLTVQLGFLSYVDHRLEYSEQVEEASDVVAL
ncbi:hypothetical protein R6258_16865 [Halomonas sp. HP20-15]|nr:hypothetical protein [Halomonas sp. HP20-15]MDW5378592.1 hypothetical protein [Halomonas sp. HP20-15]